MPHLVLLGDSVFDNAAYTDGGPAVVDQVRARLPASWQVTLAAVDGSTTRDVAGQMGRLPRDATHLALSIGGNDAMLRVDLLDTPVSDSGEALLLLAQAVREFETSYRSMLRACLAPGLPLAVCTIYHGNFDEAAHRERVAVALAVFNDAIVRAAMDHGLAVIDLRRLCAAPEDYANPIEPSTVGGGKIARALVQRALGERMDGASLCF